MHRVQTAKRNEIRLDRYGAFAEAIGELAKQHDVDSGVLYDEWQSRCEARMLVGCEQGIAEQAALDDIRARWA